MSENWKNSSEIYDFPLFDGEVKTYIMATIPRSGSHYLGHLLFSTRLMGAPLEYFHKANIKKWMKELNVDDENKVFEFLLRNRTSPNGWFGVKAHWSQYVFASQSIDVETLLSPLKWIHTKRRDKVKQAVSLAYARKSKSWISFHGEGYAAEYSFDLVYNAYNQILKQEHQWKEYFNSKHIEPLIVEYESIIEDPRRALDQCSRFLGIALEEEDYQGALENQALPEKQFSKKKEEWVNRFFSDMNERGLLYK